MKLRHGIAIGCITALLGLGAFAGAASNQRPVEKVEATTTSFAATYVYIKDEGRSWTGYWSANNYRNACIYMTDVEFDSDCGFSSIADMKSLSVSFGDGVTYDENNAFI